MFKFALIIFDCFEKPLFLNNLSLTVYILKLNFSEKKIQKLHIVVLLIFLRHFHCIPTVIINHVKDDLQKFSKKLNSC